MSDIQEEIKEILDYLKDDSKSFIICGSSYYKISDYKAKILLDYITNLQEENEYSNYCNKELRKKITNLEYKIERLEEENEKIKKEEN